MPTAEAQEPRPSSRSKRTKDDLRKAVGSDIVNGPNYMISVDVARNPDAWIMTAVKHQEAEMILASMIPWLMEFHKVLLLGFLTDHALGGLR